MHTGGFGAFPSDEMPKEERTSVLAILSLIFGIVCIPGFGVLGAILGVASLYFIGSAGGRLAGRGLAIAGIVISLLVTFLWVVILWGASSVLGAVNSGAIVPVSTLMKEIDSGNFAEAKSRLTGVAGQKITDADFAAFVAAYQAELGAFKAGPDGPVAWITDMAEMGPVMQRFQGQNNQMPIPASFANDKAILAITMDRTSTNPSGGGAQSELPISNIQIFTKSGKVFTLYDPDNRPIAPEGGAAPGDPAAPKETAPEAPKVPEPVKTPEAPK